jgi:hypothetical protein
MPGSNDRSLPGASFISDWELYRTGVLEDDDLSHPEAVEQVIDLSRNADGLNNQIWVNLDRRSSDGTVTLTLFLKNSGAWAAVEPYKQVDQQTGLNNRDQHRWTGLLAGVYVILLTSIDLSGEWDVYVAHT